MCFTKIKKNGKGQHTDCDVCVLNDIKEEKKNKLKENIKTLEDLSKNLEESIKKLKLFSENIDKKKEEIKLKIQKVFTNIRNAINEREDYLLSEVDKKFDEIYVNENIIKQSQCLPNKIKISLEKGKNIDKEWNEDINLNSLINDCISIENNIKEIKNIDNHIKKNNDSQNYEIMFYPEEENNINEFINVIKKFGYFCNNQNILKDSAIITPYDDYQFIMMEIEKRNNKIKSNKLIYKATRDGENNFYNQCSGIKDVILLIKSDNNCIFGGYTKVGFQKSNSNTFKDDSAFVFSLNTRKIYPIKKGKEAIRCCNCCGPQFYNEVIYLQKGFINRSDNFVGKISDNYNGFTKDYELNNGTPKFKILELEIYNLSF